MGKVLEHSANIDIESIAHFPTCGSFESTLSPGVSSYRGDDYSFNYNCASPSAEGLLSGSPQSAASTSFAKMLTTAPKSTWPSLDHPSSSSSGGASVPQPPKITQVTGSKQMQLVSRTLRTSSNRGQLDSDDDEENCPRVPEFKQNFSFAIAAALEKAANKQTATEGNTVNTTVVTTPSMNSSGGKKKKNKKTILFSTGIAFNGN